MRGLLIHGVVVAGFVMPAAAADLPTKAEPPEVAYDWSGFYLGGHFDHTLGSSTWSTTAGLSGTVDLSNAYNFSTGTGSYLVGLEGGYNYMSRSRWLFGLVTDVSFPSFVGGNRHVGLGGHWSGRLF